jgi:hypothetical protein
MESEENMALSDRRTGQVSSLARLGHDVVDVFVPQVERSN